jgi:hypothetical protein
MNLKLKQAALQFVERAKKNGFNGKVLDKEVIDKLNKKLIGNLPEWYAELLATIPICYLELGWQAFEPEEDFDGIDWMEICDDHGIVSESIDCYPGLAVLEKGYLNIAGDSMGGGNPYFIDITQGDDPPVYQIYHDVSDDPTIIIAEGRNLVSEHLSDLFLNGFVEE